jgi:hypothetical protein
MGSQQQPVEVGRGTEIVSGSIDRVIYSCRDSRQMSRMMLIIKDVSQGSLVENVYLAES